MAAGMRGQIFGRGRANRSFPVSSLTGGGTGAWFFGFVAWSASVLLGAAFLVFMSLGLIMSYRLITTSSVFRLTTIDIHGIERLSRDEALNTAGIELGLNCLALRMKQIRARLLSNPWISEASVRRELPGKLVVEIVERKPYFWANREGRMFYVDQEGRYIAPLEPLGITPLPLLMAESGAEGSLESLREVVRELGATNLPFRLEEADWIRLGRNDVLELAFGQPQRQLLIDLEDFSRNLRRMNQVWADLGRRGELPSVSRLRVHGENVGVVMGPVS